MAAGLDYTARFKPSLDQRHFAHSATHRIARVRQSLSTDVGTNADRGDESKTSFMSFVLALSTPESVFVILPSKITAFTLNGTARADGSSQCFPALTSLRPLGSQREEQVCESSTGRPVHPAIVCANSGDRDFDGCHVRPPGCPSALGCLSGRTGCVPIDPSQAPWEETRP